MALEQPHQGLTSAVRLGREPGRTNRMQTAVAFAVARRQHCTADNQFVSRQRLRMSASKAVGAVPFWQ
jgi:hypothetical protein